MDDRIDEWQKKNGQKNARKKWITKREACTLQKEKDVKESALHIFVPT